MEINWWGGLAGGVLVGSSAVLLLWATGRIAGVSGIVSGLMWRTPGESKAWRWVFVLGVMLGALIYWGINGSLEVEIQAHGGLLLLAGLLVGIGTRLGSGCTSGHGVCGLARRSARSLLATMVFMLSAILTVMVGKWL